MKTDYLRHKIKLEEIWCQEDRKLEEEGEEPSRYGGKWETRRESWVDGKEIGGKMQAKEEEGKGEGREEAEMTKKRETKEKRD